MLRSRPNVPRRPTEASTFRGQTNNVAAKEKEEASHGPNRNAGETSPSRRAARKVVAKDATNTNSIASGRAKDDTKTTSDSRGATLKLIDIATDKTTSGSNGNSHIVTRETTNRDSTGHPVGVDPAMSIPRQLRRCRQVKVAFAPLPSPADQLGRPTTTSRAAQQGDGRGQAHTRWKSRHRPPQLLRRLGRGLSHLR